VTDHAIKAIGKPEITVTKLAPGNPLGFKIKTAVMPEITLPDYVALAKKANAEPEEAITVEDKDIDTALEQIKEAKQAAAIDDALAQSLGDFKTLAELRDRLKENMLGEKKIRAKEKRRLAILESILDGSDFAVPHVMVDHELQKMLGQFKDDISRAGLAYDAYLTQIKKTEADIFAEWRDSAVKRAKTQLILGKISQEKKLAPDEETIKHEVDHILEHHKDADRFRARMFVENMLTNENVLKFLEEQKA
jgi:trigger factor